jgi:hypothetical protein
LTARLSSADVEPVELAKRAGRCDAHAGGQRDPPASGHDFDVETRDGGIDLGADQLGSPHDVED